MNIKKQYEQQREKIRRKKRISDPERKSQLFNVWMNYICSSAEHSRKNGIAYETEKTRVKTWS